MIRRRSAVAIAGLFVVGACASDAGGSLRSEEAPPPTVEGVGHLPDAVPTTTIDPDADPSSLVVDVVVTRPVDEDGVVLDQVADLVAGNRVIAIGDSILASTARRFGGEMCAGLEPLGWAIEVDAEPGRFVEFGNRVLDRRLPDELGDDEDWDAAIVHLGSNYRLDQQAYRAELEELLDRLAPRPTLLLTVTVYRPAWAEVNEVIEEMAAEYDNVILVDWERTARTPGVLSRDGLHPGEAGEQVLVDLIAAALGDLPGAEPDCLRSEFTDDSEIGLGTGGTTTGGIGGSSSGSSGGSGGSSSGGSSGGTSGGSGGSGGGTTGSTGGGTTTVPSGDTGGGDGGSTGGTDGGTTDSTDGGTTGGTDGGTTDSTDGGATGGTDGGTTDSADGGSTGGTDGGTTDSTGGTTGGGTTDSTGGTTGGTDGGTTDSTGGTTGGGTTDSTGGTTGGTTGGGTTDSTGGSTGGGTTDSTSGSGGSAGGGGEGDKDEP